MDGAQARTDLGRADTFEQWVRPHLDSLYRLAHHLTGTPDRAEDLVQSLLLRLYGRFERLPELDRPGPWLSRSLYHLFVDQHRSGTRQPLDLQVGGAEMVLAAMPDRTTETPDRHAERLDEQERLTRALARLPAAQRALVAWHDIEGYTLEEISVTRDIPVGTLKSRLHRARARMREMLAEPDDAPERVKARIPASGITGSSAGS